MGKQGLTDIAIRNLKPGPERREIPDPGAHGLYVVLQPSGRRGFAVRYRFEGKPTKLTLPAGISLAAARKLAAAAMNEVAEKRDPAAAKKQAEEKQRKAAADTVRAICESYLKREGKTLRTADQRRRVFERHVYPKLGDRPVGGLKRGDVVDLLDAVEDSSGPVMGDMVLALLRRVFNWHAARTDEFKTPLVKGMARTKPKQRARARVLSDDELRAVWKATGEAEGPFPMLVKFLLLTAARRTEAAEMPWSELDGADWTLPAPRNNQDRPRPAALVRGPGSARLLAANWRRQIRFHNRWQASDRRLLEVQGLF